MHVLMSIINLQQNNITIYQHLQNQELICTKIQQHNVRPKHSIAAVSKKLTTKSKKTLFLCFDLLEYLSYHLQLPFFSQITTKQFLFKISGLMMSKDVDPVVLDKILKLVKCLDEIFRPLQDLLPLFFQFQAGLLRKQYKIPFDYVSTYRPKQLKQYKVPQKKQVNKKPIVQPTKDEQKKFEQIRQKIILTNQIIDNCDPSENVNTNQLLIEMMQQLKQCEKSINQTINENPTQLIMELALASNDDLVITYRRYKDLTRNRKPQVFQMVELESDVIKQQQHRQEKQKMPPQKQKVQSQAPKQNSIFDSFNEPSSKKSSPPISQAPQVVQKKKQAYQSNQNIFDLIGDNNQKQTQVTQISGVFDLMDISPPPQQQVNANSFNLDLLGGSSNAKQNQQPQQLQQINLGDIFGLGSGSNQNPGFNSQQFYMQPLQQQSLNTQQYGLQQQSSVNPIISFLQPKSEESIQPPNYQQPGGYQIPNYQPNNYQNITLSTGQQNKPEEEHVDPEKQITNMSDFKDFLGTNNNN